MTAKPKQAKIWSTVSSGQWQVVEVPVETHIYILPPGCSIESEDSWRKLITAQYLGTKEVYLRGLEGGIDVATGKAILNWFKSRGVERVRYRHKRREKVF